MHQQEIKKLAENIINKLAVGDKELFMKYLLDLWASHPLYKDVYLVQSFFVIKEVSDSQKKILEVIKEIQIGKKSTKEINKEIKEIENTISLGIPGWIKYTRKTKKTKNNL